MNQPADVINVRLPHETEYLVFTIVPRKTKTKTWDVHSKSSLALLGEIRWYGPWRQFVFYPEYRTLFNKSCLTDIAAFLEAAMTDWREGRKR